MLLSVLIPVYNYDCRRLVQALQAQIPADAEICVLDDCSTNQGPKGANRELAGLDRVRYQESHVNLGRAKVRNALADMAQGRWLLFADCDAAVPDDKFIERYLHFMQDELSGSDTEKYAVVVGGTKVMERCPSNEVLLRYKYERNYWKRQTPARRQRTTYMSFTTFNFAIKAELFHSIRFCEDIQTYGHEDTLFGEALARCGAPIVHIANPLTHCGVDTNGTFLEKTRSALHNVAAFPDTPSRLETWRQRLCRMHMEGVVRWLLGIMLPLFNRQLMSETPLLSVFALYKLGYYLQCVKQRESSSPV